MSPKVSICLPNLNTRPFLSERFDTIFGQTLQDWELIVYDSYSDDGAWEYIQELAAVEPRMRISQGPREGTPKSWNPAIRQARGEYVYIATSDDTMAVDCLEKMAAALDAHPECGLAHCPLRVIDANGGIIDGGWETGSMFALASQEWLQRPHVRLAPFDGLLHLTGDSIYISITQLLIRRSLFDRIGYLSGDWGSQGDFHWNMRASLVANTVHVPTTWGGWRVHSAQATTGCGTPQFTQRVDAMIVDAVERVRGICPPAWMERLDSGWTTYFIERRLMDEKLSSLPNRASRLAMLVKLAFTCPQARKRLYMHLFARKESLRPRHELVRDWVQSLGIAEPCQP
jgi:glycosyltransferase involved in cell wall biosynthesis